MEGKAEAEKSSIKIKEGLRAKIKEIMDGNDRRKNEEG